LVILLCVRWYLSYAPGLRDLEEMIAERGLKLDHSTIHRWVVKYAPQLLARFKDRKWPVSAKWHVDETYIKVKGDWMYLYRAIDKQGATVDFMLSQTRNLKDAKRFFRRAYRRHGLPQQVTIDGSQTNLEAARQCHTQERLWCGTHSDQLAVRHSRYKNKRIEQDHRRIKRRVRFMFGFKSALCAAIILDGIELVHMIRKSQMYQPSARTPSLSHQFEGLAA
jgi:putative transposase